jgi:hypothetical protein
MSDLPSSENADVSELHRRILMRRMACSLVIYAKSPCKPELAPALAAAFLAVVPANYFDLKKSPG